MKQLGYFLFCFFACLPLCIQPTYRYITLLKDVSLADINLVGGKNASLGQMIRSLSAQNIRVPQGFAITVDGYALYMDHNDLTEKISALTQQITSINDLKMLKA